jgi:hypothetical protein
LPAIAFAACGSHPTGPGLDRNPSVDTNICRLQTVSVRTLPWPSPSVTIDDDGSHETQLACIPAYALAIPAPWKVSLMLTVDAHAAHTTDELVEHADRRDPRRTEGEADAS